MTQTLLTLLMMVLFLQGGVVRGDESANEMQDEAQAFLEHYTSRYQHLYIASEEATWQANIRIVEGDSTNAIRANQAREAMAAFTGSRENIETARSFLKHEDQLTKLQVKQLEVVLRKAANNPATVEPLVKRRIAAETAQVEKLYGFDFTLNGESVTTNQIDRILKTSDDLELRLAAWKASKEVGVGLKDGLNNLVALRNKTVQALGYDNFFQYMVSEYDMSVEELVAMTEQFNVELRPLFRELHTYARYTLAEKYGEPVPDLLPAHWLPNRWGQDWNAMIEVEGLDLNKALEGKDAEYVVHAGEDFYVSLGYPELPEVFYEKSSLYPLPDGADYKKNNHASAWHMDLENDVRSLMSVEPDADWWETVHHELGHIYYYMAYSNPDVPLLLRGGANRAYHEAVGSLLGLASMQQPFLVHVNLIEEGTEYDKMGKMLKEAMNSVVFIPWSCGVMTHFENDLYGEPLSQDQYNERWWALKRQYQGIVPPEPRGEEYCDAASKTHINNDPAGYYDYALSRILLQQLHDHIATDILKQDPHATNYYGSEEVGEFLWSMLEVGATGDWRQMLIDKTGSGLSAQAMLDYYAPLLAWLQEQNEGRTATLPE
ncbi:M2 family metallopeptidase [bacterium]|nr:M2 family metallopeptidase [bacterium]